MGIFNKVFGKTKIADGGDTANAEQNQLSSKYLETRNQILGCLKKNNPQEAFTLIRPILDYPGQVGDVAHWRDGFELFSRIAKQIAGKKLADEALQVAVHPENTEVLWNLAYTLYENQLYGIAATLLARSNKLRPDNPKVVSELVANLEALMFNEEACTILRQSPGALESSPMCRYLLAYNAIMTGNLDEPRTLLPSLKGLDDPNMDFVSAAIEGMLKRADSLENACTLDNGDLRGWHMVLNGALLLHRSPHGMEEGMGGRYAYVSDSYYLCREGIERVKAVLASAKIEVPCVFALADRSSQILGAAASKILDKPLCQWPRQGTDAPGLVVAYDLGEVDTIEPLEQLQQHKSGQILFAHASGWTEPFSFSPDMTTYLYQANVCPWEGGTMNIDPYNGQVTETQQDEASIDEIADRIAAAQKDEEFFEDLDELLAMISAVCGMEGEHSGGIVRKSGQRTLQRTGSPVKSSRFN